MFLVVFYAINKFHHYITNFSIFIHTDHATIRYLMIKLVMSGRIIRWLLLLQEFNVTILDKIGKANSIDDFLSRIACPMNKGLFDDSFTNE